MKKIIIVTLLLGSMICYSCKQEGSKHKMEKHDTSGPEFTSAYICPMHCKGSGRTNRENVQYVRWTMS
ncbi:MAG: hypothetical protein IPL98_13530 [Saprospiraceae bacterium]|nr:hypothetical protein [Saprospiraceae bacterium]